VAVQGHAAKRGVPTDLEDRGHIGRRQTNSDFLPCIDDRDDVESTLSDQGVPLVTNTVLPGDQRPDRIGNNEQ